MNSSLNLKNIVAKDIANAVLNGNDFYDKHKSNSLDANSIEILNLYLIKELRNINDKKEFLNILNRYKNIFDDLLIFM